MDLALNSFLKVDAYYHQDTMTLSLYIFGRNKVGGCTPIIVDSYD